MRNKAALAAGIIALAFAVVSASAMLRTSATFDEIVFMSVGARGFHMGDFSLVTDHPRLAQYLYGLPVFLSGITYPGETVLDLNMMPRYIYSRGLLWGVGNPAESLLMHARIVAVALGAATVWLSYFFARRHMGSTAAVAAAVLVALLPDMLAHSGVAYNDIALALAFLVSLYAIDAAVRDPSPRRACLAGLSIALAVCVKYSGVVLLPIAGTLLAFEALSGRWRQPAWRKAVEIATLAGILTCYLAIVLVYLGDWKLAEFTRGMVEGFKGASGRTAFLLGERYVGGRWYYFPLMFFLKTPVALHVLVLLAAIGAWAALRGGISRELLSHKARAPAVGVAFFAAGLVTSQLNIGFRHALPMLPPLCILVAQGLEPLWNRGRGLYRIVLSLLVASLAFSSLSAYPYFLSYVSEYVKARPTYETVADSGTDWGQGLIGLREFMNEQGVKEVALGYVGSALPTGYGIRYFPMPSYYTLPDVDPSMRPPRYLVVSAGLLAGLYIPGDIYAPLRSAKPVALVGGSLYVFDYKPAEAKK